MSNELLRELEDDLRQERMQKLWHSFGKFMVGASVAIIVGTVGSVLWQNHQRSYATQQTSQLIKGFDRINVEDYKGAVAVFGAVAEDEDSNYYGMAMLLKARVQLLAGDKQGAMQTYRELGEEGTSKNNRVFADLAKILAAEDAKTVIEPRKGSPLYHTQSEWKAWQLMGAGKKREAMVIFTELRDDENTPYSLRERAVQMLNHLSPGAGIAPDKK